MSTRCKKGTRKCFNGRCVNSVKRYSKRLSKRCPKGQRKCPNRRCTNYSKPRRGMTLRSGRRL